MTWSAPVSHSCERWHKTSQNLKSYELSSKTSILGKSMSFTDLQNGGVGHQNFKFCPSELFKFRASGRMGCGDVVPIEGLERSCDG